MTRDGYRPTHGTIDRAHPPQGGSGVRFVKVDLRMDALELDVKDLRRELVARRRYLGRIEALEQEVRELKETQARHLCHMAALAKEFGEQKEGLGGVIRLIHASMHRIDMNVNCIQKLNNLASTLGEGHQVA